MYRFLGIESIVKPQDTRLNKIFISPENYKNLENRFFFKKKG